MNDEDRPDRDNTTFVLFKDRHELRRAIESENPPPAPEQAVPAPGAKEPEAASAKVIPIHRRILDLKKRSLIVRRAIAALPDFVTPNAVTLGRMFLAVPIVALLRYERYWIALGFLAAAFLLDFVDGAIAEVKGMKSETGAFFDPLADKVLVCGALLAVADRVPPLCTVPIIGICLFATLLTMVRIVKMAKRRPGMDAAAPTVAAKPIGKWKMITEVASVLILTIGLASGAALAVSAALPLLAAAAVLGGMSFFSQLFG